MALVCAITTEEVLAFVIDGSDFSTGWGQGSRLLQRVGSPCAPAGARLRAGLPRSTGAARSLCSKLSVSAHSSGRVRDGQSRVDLTCQRSRLRYPWEDRAFGKRAPSFDTLSFKNPRC